MTSSDRPGNGSEKPSSTGSSPTGQVTGHMRLKPKPVLRLNDELTLGKIVIAYHEIERFNYQAAIESLGSICPEDLDLVADHLSIINFLVEQEQMKRKGE